MKKLFIRFFIDESYYEFDLENGVEVGKDKDLDFAIEDNYYFKVVSSQVVSNIFNQKALKIAKIYYVKELKIYFKIYYKQRKIPLLLTTNNLCKLINKSGNVIVDFDTKTITFDIPIYITYKLYINGTFYYGKSILICICGIEILIDKDTVYILEITKLNNKMCTYYYESKLINYIDNSKFSFKYTFDFEEEYTEFKESILKYILTPLILIFSMLVMSLILNRLSMIYFMVFSSLSSITTSYITYIVKKRNNLIDNEYLDDMFNLKLQALNDKINNDIYKFYRQHNFHLLYQNKITFGYLKSNDYDIEYNIKSKVFEERFLDYKKQFSKFYKQLNLSNVNDEIVISGKYKQLYLYNLLLQIAKLKQSVVIVGDIINIDYLQVSCNFKHIIKESNITPIDNAIIIVFDFELFQKVKEQFSDNNFTIYYDCNYSCSSLIEINQIYRNTMIKYNGKIVNEELYTLIEYNSRNILLMQRKIIFDNSDFSNINQNGLMIAKDYYLNIERDGPHGLIVGMTGSGKSVLLQTLIMSIAKSYTVDEAVIGIIDFKGGSLISKVKNIPHICGTYSNLNDDYENVIASIESELTYRQLLFKENNISEHNETIGLLKLPKLFIFIDEFAEVKLNASELVEKIISIARIGRSLGIYLILSLQKSSGIVDEQLKSNLGFTICLKVNSKQDSADVVGVNDAYYFTNPGEAIINIKNKVEKFNVFNSNDTKRDDIVINNLNYNTESYFNNTVSHISEQYHKTEYVVWKSFPNNKKNCMLLNDPLHKEFIEYQFNYDNYLLIGNKLSCKSEIVKNILSKVSVVTFYLGTNNQFKNLVDNYFEMITYLDIYLEFMKYLNRKLLFIIDDLEKFSDNNNLIEFLGSVVAYKYPKIRVIVTASSTTSTLNRLIKYFNHRFLLLHNDPSEVFNLFFQKSNLKINDVNEGICIYNNKLLQFRNYSVNLKSSKKLHCLKRLNGLYYLNNFYPVFLDKAVIIYDRLPNDIQGSVVNSDKCEDLVYPLLIDYKLVNNRYSFIINLIEESELVFTMTNKLEYKFLRFIIYDKMMYDIKNEIPIIITKYLDVC